MRWTTLAPALAILGTSQAVSFPRATIGKGFLSVPIGTTNNPKHKTKRDGEPILQQLENRDFFYSAEIGFGNPPQNITVLVDTGSNELWVNPDCSTAPTNDQYRQCQSFGHYDPDKSSTPPIGPFGKEVIRYGDASDASTQTSATIHYYTETLTFGGAKLKNQTFGVVSESDGISQGILGLSPDLRGGFQRDYPYSLVLSSMADQGLIKSRTFALDLRHSDAETGAVIYGGVDRSKYIGKFETVPIIRGAKGEYRLAVTLTGLGATLSGKKQNFALDKDDTNVMLDSGTTISRMHYSAAYPILDALGATEDGEGYYYTRCSARDRDGSVDFGFGNMTVNVPLSDFILDIGDGTYCYIGVVITTDQQILGDSVLRAGYFVFDWDNVEVHVAQAANCGDDDIVAVGKDEKSIAEVTGECKPSDARVVHTTTVADATKTNSLPTNAYTTVYTITSCPPIAENCKTGVVTTQTVGPARATVTVTGSADPSDSGAMPKVPVGSILAVIGAFAIGLNLV